MATKTEILSCLRLFETCRLPTLDIHPTLNQLNNVLFTMATHKVCFICINIHFYKRVVSSLYLRCTRTIKCHFPDYKVLSFQIY